MNTAPSNTAAVGSTLTEAVQVLAYARAETPDASEGSLTRLTTCVGHALAMRSWLDARIEGVIALRTELGLLEEFGSFQSWSLMAAATTLLVVSREDGCRRGCCPPSTTHTRLSLAELCRPLASLRLEWETAQQESARAEASRQEQKEREEEERSAVARRALYEDLKEEFDGGAP